jgi:type II secretory pathway component PulF
MLTYSYRVRNGQGIAIVGEMLAEHRDAAVDALRKKGYYLIRVEPQGYLVRILRSGVALGNRVRVREKAIFTHQLATLLRAGSLLSMALGTLAKQTSNRYFSSVIQQLHNDIESSCSLSDAMAKHPRVFSEVYCAVVAAAEESGALPETLTILSAQLKSQASVNARIKGALLYPAFLLVVSVLVVGVLTTFVVPKFIELFVNTNQKLPLPTVILVSATRAIRTGWWMMAVGAAGLVSLCTLALKHEPIRFQVDDLLLRLPCLGDLSRKRLLARFSRTLGSLLDGGVRIVSAIQTTRRTTGNRAFARSVTAVGDALLRGSTLAQAIREQPYFSEIGANMVGVGEESGTLPEMLLEMADMYDEEYESVIHSLTTLLGPAMIVLLGLLVGFVVMAILLPVFETSTIVR